jgi:hypothetical protein
MRNALIKEKILQSSAGIFSPPISLKSFDGGCKLINNKGIKQNKSREQIRLVY